MRSTTKRTTKKAKAAPAVVASPNPNETPRIEPKLTPVVAIGASAGGGAAMTELLSHLPADTGLAFVYIQHLDPQLPNPVPAVLQRVTTMPALEAVSGQVIEPNTIYVAPGASEVLLEDGRLMISHYPPRNPSSAKTAPAQAISMPVDTFFRSLASKRKSAAMGVVLSGTATDGSLGLKAIKAEGGITFAQEPRTARYDGMPSSAIATGCVDFVLTPREIALEIANIARHPYLVRSVTAPPDAADDREAADNAALDPILKLLRNRVGVDFGLYKNATIRRRIGRRMALRQLENLAAYHEYLLKNPDELNALYNDLLISVTEFFRDPDTFEALKEIVFPRIVKSSPGNAPIRIWVPGCSTGEEVYSLAICALEYLKEAALTTPVQIFGTDLSEAVIERARAGIYPANSVTQEVSADRLRRFFTQVESGYQISSSIREMCVFARQNITSDPPFSRLDLISCRNVLIYLSAPLQKKVMQVFHYALKPSGFLLLGNSENIPGYNDLFASVDKKHHIFSRKPTPVRAPLDFSFPPLYDEKPAAIKRSAWTPLAEMQKEADRLILQHVAPPGVLITEDGTIIQFRGQTGRFLEPAPGEASLNVMKMAREGLLLDLRTAVHNAAKKNATVRREGLRLRSNGGFRDVNLLVIPVRDTAGGERCFIVLFEDVTVEKQPHTAAAARKGKNVKSQTSGTAKEYAALRDELHSTKLYLQSIIEEHEATSEELTSANEEIQSSNEELQSTNEELETAKEELQSTNEELSTMNEELNNRNVELTQVNNDLNNLLSSVSIPIVMLGSDLRIRRFTPMAEKVLNLIPADVGRPLMDIKPNIELPNLEEILVNVLRTPTIQEMQVRDRAGHWYSMWVRPYKTAENKIDGVVISLMDVDALKRASERERSAREFSEAVIDTVQDGLVVLDSGLRVKSASRSFFQSFRLQKANVEGRSIYDLDNGDWNIPGLRELLEQTRDKNTRNQNFEVEHGFNKLGIRRLILNARRIEDPDEKHMILFAVADVTDRQQDIEIRYRRLFEASKDSMIVVDAESGRITDVNPYTLEWLGYSRNELLGNQIWSTPIFSDQERAQFMFRQALEQGHARFDDVHLWTGDHRTAEAEVIASAYLEGPHKLIQFNMRDISDRRKAEEQIRASLRDKELLIQEVHHRVKNNLQVISSILSLQSQYVGNVALATALNETRNRVRAIATIHEMLFQTKGFARIEIAPYLRKIANALLDFYGAPESGIGVDTGITPAWLDIDKAIPCGLIVNELVSNALKHAFPDNGTKGRIEISLESEPEGQFVLKVRDNGRGFPADFEPRKAQSLGLQMVYLLTDQLGGSVQIASRGGAEVVVRFPIGRTVQ